MKNNSNPEFFVSLFTQDRALLTPAEMSRNLLKILPTVIETWEQWKEVVLL